MKIKLESEVTYRLCLCTFIDVLGFAALVEQSIESQEARDRIHFILKEFEQSYSSKGMPGDRVRTEPLVVVRSFSDLILRIVPLTDQKLKDGTVRSLDVMDEIVHEGIDLCGAQFSLLQAGIVVRGGLTLGSLFWENNHVFGPAVVRAYKLERDVANYPRIVVDSSIVEHFPKVPGRGTFAWNSYFRQDFDGVWFVDFLNFFVAFSAPNIIFNRTGYRTPFEKLREFLVEQLSRNEAASGTRAKYVWLANYFNSTVGRAPENSGVGWANLRISLKE